jgi:hypothetical protein
VPGSNGSAERALIPRSGRSTRCVSHDKVAPQPGPGGNEVARLPGVHRNTISRWLARCAVGGLDTLLATYIPAGKPVSLAPDVLASLEQALRGRGSFASYNEAYPRAETSPRLLHAVISLSAAWLALCPRPALVQHPSLAAWRPLVTRSAISRQSRSSSLPCRTPRHTPNRSSSS